MGSKARSVKSRAISGLASALVVSASIRANTASGVPRNAKSPVQFTERKPGNTLAMGGTPGSAALGAAEATPSALMAPPRICGSAVPSPSNIIGTLPATRSVMAGALPR